MSKRRVVVSSLGVTTPLGIGVADLWSALLEGRSAVRRTNLVEASGEPRHLVATAPSFNARQYIADRKLLRVMQRTDQLGLVAAAEAVAGAPAGDVAPTQRGAFMGARKDTYRLEDFKDAVDASREQNGEVTARKMGTEGYGLLGPLTLVTGLPNGCLFAVSVLHTIKGSNANVIGTGEVGLTAVGAAYAAVQEGQAEWALTGGHDSATDRWNYANFYRLGLLTQFAGDPARAVRPFDRRRDGFAPGEGAGMLVLEPLERARARGTRILAEVTGYAATCDATGLVTPRSEGTALADAISRALAEADVVPDEVDYVNAYACATQAGDRTELRALEAVFGSSCRRPLVSSIKGAIGHLIAGSGAVEAAATVLALTDQVVPPTVNLEQPDADCGFDCVPQTARAATIRNAIAISRGIGGQNAVLALRRWED